MRSYWRNVAESFASANDIIPENIVRGARPGDGLAPRMIAEVKRKMNAKTGKRITPKDRPLANDIYLNYSQIPLKLSPQADYLFLVVAEGKAGEIDLYVDGKLAVSTKPGPYPFIACRLLTPAQQNTGDPSKQRAGCALTEQRADAVRIQDASNTPRDVELVVYNNRQVTDTLASADLNYTIRVYQWVPGQQSNLR